MTTPTIHFSAEESVETLDANMLLYKASRVANLGVMSEAIALGADKNWVNVKEESATPLHQAIYGVSLSRKLETPFISPSKFNPRTQNQKESHSAPSQNTHLTRFNILIIPSQKSHFAPKSKFN
jgi:Arf-GAP/coiled-coil/ANK repeat/PH domain-containing protein